MNLSKELPDAYIDLVVTSPPYADTVSYGKDINVFSPENYPDWILPLFIEANRFLKPTGSFILNIHTQDVINTDVLYIHAINCNPTYIPCIATIILYILHNCKGFI